MNRLFIIFMLLCIGFSMAAQDRQFTQFYASPLTLNPALTGAFDGKYRLAGIYRDQWRGAINDPFKTYAASLEVKFGLDQVFKMQYKDKVAVGIMFYSDQVNSIEFNTTQMAFSTAYHKALDASSTQYLTIGIQGALGQRNVSYGNFTFEDQFDGEFGYSLPTQETLPPNNFSFTDLNAGINYSVAINRKLSFFLGGAIHHIGTPEVSFYYDKEEPNGISHPLFQKYTAHISSNIKITESFALIPRASMILQGPYLGMNIGTNARLSISEYNGTAIQFGTWLRPVQNPFDDSFNVDALVALIGLEHNGMLIGLSYDLNLKDLSSMGGNRNSFELSVAYIGEYDSESILCPKF